MTDTAQISLLNDRPYNTYMGCCATIHQTHANNLMGGSCLVCQKHQMSPNSSCQLSSTVAPAIFSYLVSENICREKKSTILINQISDFFFFQTQKDEPSWSAVLAEGQLVIQTFNTGQGYLLVHENQAWPTNHRLSVRFAALDPSPKD